MSNEDMALPRTHIEEMDFAEMQHRQKAELTKIQEAELTKRAKYELREARQETYQIIGVAIAVAAVLITLALVWWNPWEPPSPPEPDNEGLREIACVQNGGGFVPEDLLVSGSHGICIYPGKAVETPSE